MDVNTNYAGGGFGMPMGSGSQFSGINPNQQAKFKTILTDEEIGRLVQKENVFSLAITELEKLRAICGHRFPTGADALTDTTRGTQQCQICGYEFAVLDPNTNPDNIREDVERVKDILQTIKLLYLDMPVEVAREFFVLIALLDKVPELFKMACKDYARHERFVPYGTYNDRMSNIINIYNMLTGGANIQPNLDQYGRPVDPGFAPNSMYNYGNPAFRGMPGNQNMQFDPNMVNNIMGGYGAGAYQTQTQGYQYDPAQQAAAATTTTANTDANVTDVKNTFKA